MMNDGALYELPGGWVWTTLGDIISVHSGKGLTTYQMDQSGIFPVYGGNGITGYHNKFIFEESKLIIGRVGAKCGAVHKTSPKCWITDNALIVDSWLIDTNFLFHVLRNLNLNRFSVSTAQPVISSRKIYPISFGMAPLPEQRAIVSKIEQLFSDLDNGIENFKAAQKQLKIYRQAVLKNACEGKLVPTDAELARNEGRDYEPADVLLVRILEERREKWNGKGKYKEPAAPDTSGLPELPKGWGWARLDSLADLKGGITKDSKRILTNARKIPYLRVANVQRGYLDLNEMKEIEAQESVISELLLRPGDILFTEGGDRDKLGRGCVWQGEILECIHQNHVFRARLYSTEASDKIISWFGNTYGQIYFMREGKQTTNLASINLTKLSAFPVPLPP